MCPIYPIKGYQVKANVFVFLFFSDEMEGEFKIAMLNGTPAQVEDAKSKIVECIQMVIFFFCLFLCAFIVLNSL